MKLSSRTVGGYLKSIVYGGMDGIITTFAVVASIMGANLATGSSLIVDRRNRSDHGVCQLGRRWDFDGNG